MDADRGVFAQPLAQLAGFHSRDHGWSDASQNLDCHCEEYSPQLLLWINHLVISRIWLRLACARLHRD